MLFAHAVQGNDIKGSPDTILKTINDVLLPLYYWFYLPFGNQTAAISVYSSIFYMETCRCFNLLWKISNRW
jgi:hypothetical protein